MRDHVWTIVVGVLIGLILMVVWWWTGSVFSLELKTDYRDESALPTIEFKDVASGRLMLKLRMISMLGRVPKQHGDYYKVKQFEVFPDFIRDDIGMDGVTIAQSEKDAYYQSGLAPYDYIGFWQTEVEGTPYMITAQRWRGGRIVLYITPLLSMIIGTPSQMWERAFGNDPTVFVTPVLTWKDQSSCMKMTLINESICSYLLSKNTLGEKAKSRWISSNKLPVVVENGVSWVS